MAESERILVAGGGIGGLVAARALRGAGFAVHVLERAPALAPVGAGITVQINAMLALRRLGIGLDAAVAAAGNTLREGVIADARGRTLSRMDVLGLEQRLGAPLVAIHRARLQEVLLETLDPDVVETGAAVNGFEADDDGVTVRLEDDGTRRGRALVGADGLRSAVRRQLLGDGEPRYAGYTSWRGVAEDGGALPRERAVEAWGRGRRFGIVPLDAERVYWFATANTPAGGSDPPGGALPHLRRAFDGWFDDVRLLLERTAEDAVVRTDCCDRAPAARWGAGRVTLLGDAAHPMTPNLGQGGCQAIEDAVALAAHLARAPDLESGLRAYERARGPRARWFVVQSRRFGRVAQAGGPLAATLRDWAVRLTPAAATERSLRRRYVPEPLP